MRHNGIDIRDIPAIAAKKYSIVSLAVYLRFLTELDMLNISVFLFCSSLLHP
ncbi:MPPV-053 alkaline phosphodiesterase-like protein [Magpiepox virus 2]|nr:MPPV-053 alkaline phosphodiesterase-like protein [Magpiepox virus 2]